MIDIKKVPAPHKIKAALDDLNAGTSRSSAAQNKSARTGGDSSIDMSRLHEMLHSEFRD